MSGELEIKNRVRITDLDASAEQYVAVSIEAAKPEHRTGYALALAHNQAVQLGKICYEPLPCPVKNQSL